MGKLNYGRTMMLEDAIDNEDWTLVIEAKNLLENEEFEDFVDDDLIF